MRIIRSNKSQFEYDIHALVKSFYPEWEVRVLAPDAVVKDPGILEIEPSMEISFDAAETVLRIRGGLHNLEPEAGTPGSGEYHEYVLHDTDGMDPAEYKNAFRRFFYMALREETGISLPWGNLTGIRPTKIAMTMMEQGKSVEEIAAFLKTNHFVSGEKTALGIEIAKRERRILGALHYEDGYSLYIGIPFCPTTCLYCSFTSYPIGQWQKRVGEYLTALEAEIDAVAALYRGKVLDTVYVGGGTPSALSAEELDRLLGKLKSVFDFATVQEFTVEAGRADSITEDKLRVLYRHGVTRISVNPQTMKQDTLRLIGRQHTVEQVEEAFQMARQAGFDNINMDIILGLPGETAPDVAHTIEAVRALGPDALTVHSLAVKRASKLQQWIQEHGVTAYNNTEETMRIAAQGAADMDMVPYYLYRQKNMSGNFENVGYSREGKYGIYNILIMEEVQTIAALGAGSISKRVYPDGRIERSENVKEAAQYIERIEEMIERKRQLLSD